MLLWLYTHVSSVLSVLDVCCKVFHLDILKVDLGTSREQTFSFLRLVPVGIGPRTNKRISPSWNHQPRQESSAHIWDL
jgi:hypothetical protein